MSVPELLTQLKQHFDASALEAFELRKKLMDARKELSHSLYRYDAACRVIARLLSQKGEDGAQPEDTAVPARKRSASEALVQEDEPVARQRPEESEKDRTQSAIQDATNFAAAISALRKKRTMPLDLMKPDEISGMKHKLSISVGESSSASISAMDCCNSLLAIGNTDGKLAIFDYQKGEIVAEGEPGDGKSIAGLSFVRPSSLVGSVEEDHSTPILSGDRGGMVHLWRSDGARCAIQSSISLASKPSPLVSISVHPSGNYFMAVGDRGTWHLCDVNKFDCIKTWEDPAASTTGPFTCGSFHPDGMLVCIGQANGPSALWDVRQEAPVGHLDGGVRSICSLSFSENGYHMATGESSEGGYVRVWDLRKLQELKRLDPSPKGASSVSVVQFDGTGRYLLAGGREGFSVYGSKQQWKNLLHRSDERILAASFGPSARWLASGGAGNKIAIYGS